MSSKLSSLWNGFSSWFKGEYEADDEEFIYFWDDVTIISDQPDLAKDEFLLTSRQNRIAQLLVTFAIVFSGITGLLGNSILFLIFFAILVGSLLLLTYTMNRDYRQPLEGIYQSLKAMNEFNFRLAETTLATTRDNSVNKELIKFKEKMIVLRNELAEASQASVSNVKSISHFLSDFQSRLGDINHELDSSYSNVISFQETKGYLQKVSESIDKFTNTFDQALFNIDELSSLTRSVGKQISMLALNAGIEAARAGESGIGFEVVASNLRRLSQHALESTGEIKNITKRIGQDAQDSIEDISTALEELEALVNRSHNTLSRIHSQINHVNSRTDKIGELSNTTEIHLEKSNQSIKQIKV